MAGEIIIPISICPHPSQDANGYPIRVSGANNVNMPRAWAMPDTVAVNYQGQLAFPIPSWVNAVPAAKVYLRWLTRSADVANATKFFVYVKDIQPETEDTDFASWDDSLTVLDTSTGAGEVNECFVSISTAAVVSGRELYFRIRRNKPGDAADQLSAVTYMLKAWLIADKA